MESFCGLSIRKAMHKNRKKFPFYSCFVLKSCFQVMKATESNSINFTLLLRTCVPKLKYFSFYAARESRHLDSATTYKFPHFLLLLSFLFESCIIVTDNKKKSYDKLVKWKLPSYKLIKQSWAFKGKELEADRAVNVKIVRDPK